MLREIYLRPIYVLHQEKQPCIRRIKSRRNRVDFWVTSKIKNVKKLNLFNLDNPVIAVAVKA